jgi:hypothetical protein
MMVDTRERLYFLLSAVLAALMQRPLQHSTHTVAARLSDAWAAELRFLTKGFLTSQAVYAAPLAERNGAHRPVIAWEPVVTTPNRCL